MSAAATPSQRPRHTIGTISRAFEVFGPYATALSASTLADVCTYCGCQAIDAIAELTAEHDLVVNISGEILRALAAGDHDGAAERARAAVAVLAAHTAVEEGALFPAMSEAYAEHVNVLRVEHRLIEAALAESADGTPTDGGWPARLERALWVLREHILKEEDGVFPAALAELGPEQWDALDDLRVQVGSGIRAQA